MSTPSPWAAGPPANDPSNDPAGRAVGQLAGPELLERAVGYTRASVMLVPTADLGARTPCGPSVSTCMWNGWKVSSSPRM